FWSASGIIAGVFLLFVLALGVAEPSQQPQPTTIPEMWDAWCARCHAQDGSGKMPEPTITVEPMDFTDCRVTSPEPDADWQLAISHGGPAVGLSSEMPAFGDSLTADQVSGFVAHMRTLCRDTGWPSGNTNFPRPIVTEKAFPENEFVLLPSVSHDSAAIAAVYERRFGKRSMWEVALPVHSRDGIDDIEVAVKQVLYSTNSHILSGGLEVVVPTGLVEPYLAFGASRGSMYFQAQTKLELPARRDQAERAFVYNLYAGRDTSNSPNTWTLGVELNGENRELAITPQLRKGLTKTGALGASLGVQIPLNRRDRQHTRVIGYLLWEYLEPVRARP
ncbi:MAG: cytochrome c, partial [Acidobacteria bacterium]|nr:cytochrome c [Acidobacteriota bacterium]